MPTIDRSAYNRGSLSSRSVNEQTAGELGVGFDEGTCAERSGMRSKLICLVLLVLFVGAGPACGGEGEEQRLPTSPAQEGEDQEQEGGETEQEDAGGE